MKRTILLTLASLLCTLAAPAQQRSVDTDKSTITIHVGKTGILSGLGHEHEVRAPIHGGTAELGANPVVEIHVDARALQVIDKDASDQERAEVQQAMLGPEVLDSRDHPDIIFKSTAADSAGQNRWTLRGNLTLRGQTRPVTVQVTLDNNHYTGEATVKLTDFAIKPPGNAGVKAKNEIKIQFDIQLVPYYAN
jgi:polyisoprenoid-binding protein YceI